MIKPSPTHLSREIVAILDGPPEITQQELATRASIPKSKLNRLISGRTKPDRKTLDQLVAGAPDDEARRRLVAAYVRDMASPQALGYLSGGGDPWAELDRSKVSPRSRSAVRFLLARPGQIEKLLQDLASALGWKP